MRNNIEAIRVAFRLGVEKRPPTADANELADAAKWSKSDIELFAPTVELRRLIHDYSKNDKEFAAYMDSLKASVLTAFYTPSPVIDALADTMKERGVKVGSFLEPSAGQGAFVDLRRLILILRDISMWQPPIFLLGTLRLPTLDMRQAKRLPTVSQLRLFTITSF